MTESRTSPDKSGACLACGAERVGRYCHACGQDSHARAGPLRDMVLNAVSEVTSLDGKMARTLHALALQPGRLLEAYRAGADSRFVTPPKLFLVCTALFIALIGLSSVTLFQYTWKVSPGATPVVTIEPDSNTVQVAGAVEEDRWLQRHVDPAIDPRIEKALEQARDTAATPRDRAAVEYEIAANAEQVRFSDRLSNWLGNLLWILLPFYALLLAPLFGGRRRLLIEHVVFGMWAHAIVFLMMIGLAGLNALGADLPAWILLAPYLAYFTLAARRYYGVSVVGGLWRGLVHTVAYGALIILPALVLILASVTDWDAYMAWLSHG